MIKGFKCAETERLFNRENVRKFPTAILRGALKKLFMLHNAEDLGDLLFPRGNRLEALKGDKKGVYSIRVNDQYRVCFRWTDGNAHDVEIIDYH
ncbi:MAG: type II toxin-antitoxin system RelE/ParE family toxin [Nitrospinae bacterium]|nr:type II toxin-antitoxin system RelE/ParE family toxin [Nitrospinota bacterium]